MNAKILTFSSHGDTTLLEYDPATADMDEVNRVIAEYEAKTGAQPFDMATGERISKATSEQRLVHLRCWVFVWRLQPYLCLHSSR